MEFSFNIKPLPAIIFGPGCFKKVSTIAPSIGSKFVVITGKNFLKRQNSWNYIEEKLFNADVTLLYTRITSEPTPESIDSIVTEFYAEKPDGVIAIGGGSVLDAGKAISAMLPAGTAIEQFLEGVGKRRPDGTKIPFIAVPTTAGTGSEASANAVITRPGPDGFKKSLRHDRYIPDHALIDPELMLSCPPPLTAACSMDTFTQLVEGFLSTNGSPLTDCIAFSGIEAVQRSLLQVYQNGDDLSGRSDMAYAALCSGIVLANAGLGIIHGLAPALGGFSSMPHGLVCGTLMAAGNDITLTRILEHDQKNDRYRSALAKYEKLGRLFCPDKSGSKNIAAHFVELLYRLTELFDLPKLSEYGIKTEHLDVIIENSSNKNNPVELSKTDMRKMLLKRL